MDLDPRNTGTMMSCVSLTPVMLELMHVWGWSLVEVLGSLSFFLSPTLEVGLGRIDGRVGLGLWNGEGGS